MRPAVIWTAIAGAILSTALCLPAEAKPPPARFVEGACKLPVPGVAMRCGEVIVPESRKGGVGRTIALGVQVVLAKATPQHADPIILLGGGPGEILTDKAAAIAQSPFLRDRDVILLDQRGVGLSRPALVCESLSVDERVDGFLTPEERAKRVKACAERYGLVTDLSAYSTSENAADVVDVVHALGYRQWNILGVSYGTRLGLSVMRMKPAGLRAVALDSPYPPEVNGFDAKPSLFFDQLDKILADCAADTACAGAFPDLKARSVAALLALAAHPAATEVHSRGGGPIKAGVITARLALNELRSAMYDHAALHRVPLALDQLAKGDYPGFFSALDGPRNGETLAPPRVPGGFALGMQLSIQCSDEQGWGGQPRPSTSTWPKAVRDAFRYPYVRGDCRDWPVRSAPAKLHVQVKSHLPVLVLAGGYDPVTPPVLGREMLTGLPNGHLVIVPDHGHSITTTACGQILLSQFIQAPGRPLDESCVAAAERNFHFQTSP